MANKVGRPERLTEDKCKGLVKLMKERGLNLTKTANMAHVKYITLVKALERHGLKEVKTRTVKVNRTKRPVARKVAATA